MGHSKREPHWVWGLVVIVLLVHYLFLTDQQHVLGIDNTCDKHMFNCEGLGELAFIPHDDQWALVIVKDSTNHRYLNQDKKRFLKTHEDTNIYLARDTCELKRVYMLSLKNRPSWPPRTGKISRRLHE